MALLLLMTIVSISFFRLLELLQNAEFFEIVDGQHNSSIEAFLACCSFIKHTEHQSINAETINCFSTAMSNASEICMNVRRARCRQVGAYLHWLYDHKYTDLDYSFNSQTSNALHPRFHRYGVLKKSTRFLQSSILPIQLEGGITRFFCFLQEQG